MRTDRWDELAARIVMAPPSGPCLTPGEKKVLSEGRVGHLILFASNLKNRRQARALIEEAQSLLPRKALVAVDQEGGIVSPASRVIGSAPSPMHLGATRDRGLVERWAQVQASRLRSLGINMVLAPCLDVEGPAGSQVIGTRSYGGDPRLVARMGVAAVRGYLRGGVVPVAKHFPGHGWVRGDSHTILPVDRRSAEAIQARDLLPFRSALREGVPAVLIGHVAYPGLGTGGRIPASASREVIGKVLREAMGFRGVVMSDALEMAAYGGKSLLRRSLAAGIDLFCCGASLAQGAGVSRSLACALRGGEVDPARVARSADRLERLAGQIGRPGKERPGLLGKEPTGIVYLGESRFRPLPPRGWHALLPARLGGSLSLPLDWDAVWSRRPTKRIRRCVTRYPFDPSPERVEALLRKVSRQKVVVLAVLGRGELPKGQRALLRILRRRVPRPVLVSLLDPEPVLALPWPERLFTFDLRGETLEALFQILLGERRAGGRLPLPDPPPPTCPRSRFPVPLR